MLFSGFYFHFSFFPRKYIEREYEELNLLEGILSGSAVKNLPSNPQEMWAPSQGRKDPLEKKMATHSSILVLEIPWTEKPGRLQAMGSQIELDTA